MRELVRVLILLVSVGFSTADGQAQQPSTTSHQGYMRCSLGTNQELIPVYLEPCQLPVSNLACGEKVTVLERHSPSWLKIQTPDGITRYMRSFTVSQAPDKFVALTKVPIFRRVTPQIVRLSSHLPSSALVVVSVHLIHFPHQTPNTATKLAKPAIREAAISG